MKYVIAMLVALVISLMAAQPALATPGWGVAGQQTITYTPVFDTTIGDGSDSQGGLAPALTGGSINIELADIADNFTASTYLTTGVSRNSTTNQEAKFRTVCDFGFIGHFDPLISPGTANFGHLHMFFGNTQTNKDSDYSTLRQNGESTCAGDKLNRTGYWAPAFMEDLPSGVSAVRAFNRVVVYYTGNKVDAPQLTRFPRGFSYIGGYDPADPNNTKLTGPINSTNTANNNTTWSVPGSSGVGTSSGTGFIGWICLATDQSTPVNGSNANSPVSGSQYQPYLRNPNGTATLTCPTDGGLMAEIIAPPCWDGKNLGSADQRHHVSYRAHNGNTGKDDCPQGWYVLPEFHAKFIWGLKGTEDVGKFYLSSDVMDYGAAAPSSRSPCRQVSNHYCNGETFHFDWFGAWSYGTAASPGPMVRWMVHCTGIKIVISGTTLNGDPAECDSSTIDQTNAMQIGGTTAEGYGIGDPSIFYENAAPTSKYRLESGRTGTFVIKHQM